MSNIKDSKFQSIDLAHTKSYFETNSQSNLKKEDINNIIDLLHHASYCIKIIATKLDAITDINKKIFIKEMLSDYLTLIHLLINNFEIPASLLLRRIIELFYNHIFYFDHPIEYIQLERGKNEYTPILELKKYIEQHPLIPNTKDPNIKIFNDTIFGYYHDISKKVHAKGSEHMALFENIQQLKQDTGYLTKFIPDAKSLSHGIVYILFKVHNKLQFTPVETSIITGFLPRNYRRKMTE